MASPHVSVTNDLQRFLFALRNNVGKPTDLKTVFVGEMVQRARESHRTDISKGHDSMASMFIKALETFQLAGGNPNEMACALTVLQIVLQLELTPPQLLQCHTALRVCLLSATDFPTVTTVAKLIGDSMALTNVPSDVLRRVIEDAVVWIGLTESKSEVRRVGGLVLIAEAAERSPVHILKHIEAFFERIWVPLADPLLEVREAALHAFRCVIRVLGPRDRTTRVTAFSIIFSKLKAAVSSKHTEQQIAGLTVVEPIVLANIAGDGLTFRELMPILSPTIDRLSNSLPARLLILRVFAALCRFDSAEFQTNTLKSAVNFALELVKREGAERQQAFKMLAEVMEIVRTPGFDLFLDATIVAIKHVFITQKRQHKPPVWEALECLATICRVYPSSVAIEAHVSSCIEHVFGYGLSTQLIECMRAIVATSSPAARLKLEESMLDLISITLCGLPFRQPQTQQQQQNKFDFLSLSSHQGEPTEDQIAIALDALLKFGFSNSEQLGDFLRDSVLPFVDSEKVLIRSAAVRTITALLIPATSSEDLTFARRICVDLVVTRLLVLGGSDSDPMIRKLIFASFTSPYHKYLCEPQFLFQVCNALGDEDPLCRVAVVKLLCGMQSHNPSHILPVIRKEVVKNLQLVASTEQQHLIEQGLDVIAAIADELPSMARAFYVNILRIIAPLFIKATPRTQSLDVLLHALKSVCSANAYASMASNSVDINELQLEVISKLMDFLRLLPMEKATQSTRILCVMTLGALLRPVMDCNRPSGAASPYELFPSLYKILASIIRNKDECTDIRVEALRATGKIGALDPHQFSAMHVMDASAINAADSIVTYGKLTPKSCSRVVLQAIAMILDPKNVRGAAGSESLLRTTVKTTLLVAERSPSSHEELGLVIPPICALLRVLPTDSRLFFTVLHELSTIVTLCEEKAHEHLTCIEELVVALWPNVSTRFILLKIMSALTEVEGLSAESQVVSPGSVTHSSNANPAAVESDGKKNIATYLAKFMPTVLDAMVSCDNEYFRKSVLLFMLRNDGALQPFVHRICTTFLEILDNTASSADLCSDIIVLLRHIARAYPLQEMVAPVVRCLLARLTQFMSVTIPVPSETHPFVSRLLSCLRVLVVQQQGDFAPFAPDVLRTLKTLRLNNQELAFMCTQTCRSNGKILMTSRSVMEMDGQVLQLRDTLDIASARGLAEVGEIWGNNTGARQSYGGNDDGYAVAQEMHLPINESLLLQQLRLAPCPDAETWTNWFDELARTIIRESPYMVLRCIAASPGVNSPSLIERCPELVQDVLNVAFRSMYYNASAMLKAQFADTLERTISSFAPDDVISQILAIAEYMDMIGAPLPISTFQLAVVAKSKGMLAKALYWHERNFRTGGPTADPQALISIYGAIGHVASAVGIQTMAQAQEERSVNLSQQQTNLIKLGRHAEALELILRSQAEGTDLSGNGSPFSGTSMALSKNNSSVQTGGTPAQLQYNDIVAMLGASSLVEADAMLRNSVAHSPAAARPKHGRIRSLSHVSEAERMGSFNSTFAAEDPLALKLEEEVRKVHCLSEVGDMHSVLAEWRLLHSKLGSVKLPSAKSANSMKPNADDDEESSLLNHIATYAADAAVRLKSWDDLSDAIQWVPKETLAAGTSLAVLHLSNRDYEAASAAVRSARQLLLEEITGLMHESYARAYEGIVIAQQLVEIEETISTLKLQNEDVMLMSAQKSEVSRIWNDRIARVAQTVPTWKRLLFTRALLLDPAKDISTRILFVKLCREFGYTTRTLERFTLEQMLGCRSPTYDQLVDASSNPRVVFEYITHLSACGELQQRCQVTGGGDEKHIISRLLEIHGGKPEHAALEARMYAHKAYGADVADALVWYRTATEKDPSWFRGWRFWAEANAKLLDMKAAATAQTMGSPSSSMSSLATSPSLPFIANGIQAFAKSIELAPSIANALQDVLKLLSFWSKHCDSRDGLLELEKYVFDISLNVWLLVIPQLIARLDSGSDGSCCLVAKIIVAVAEEHPEALIYPLNLCANSKVERRKYWANSILESLEEKNPQLVHQGKYVGAELTRIATLIYEQWHETFENAASAFFGRRSPLEMLEILVPAHDKFAKHTPETMAEVQFYAKYARLLEDARSWLKSYSFTAKIADLHCAWNIYHGIYKQLDQDLKANVTLSMAYCSPRLWEARNLALTIPDTATLGKGIRDARDAVRISSFGETLHVIASKQRPKRIGMQGSDGKQYKFLLKGHEDLRLDERVMQLFKLVNTLLVSHPHTSKIAGYQIQRYTVTPLCDTVGLIGWVDECDTIHQLVHGFREERGIQPELELKMMQNIILVDQPKAYDYLTVMSKMEVLEFLWDHSSGHDLRKAMWTSSMNCETWLERRKTYTTSLATMSVVGYILGLGDRHPNNIMIQRSTGKVVHIDFGDCFEVAMQRDRFPERVPFRLTRMLKHAMEVCGVDGIFRSSAETVMAVLRENKDSLIAMLAAFVQDPLISWRLVKRSGDDPALSNEIRTIEVSNNVARQDTDNDAPLMNLIPFSDDDDQMENFNATVNGMGATSSFLDVAAQQEQEANAEAVAHQGVEILSRLASKLRGQEFSNAAAGTRSRQARRALDPKSQVGKLIAEATDIANVAQSWSGWYPFW